MKAWITRLRQHLVDAAPQHHVPTEEKVEEACWVTAFGTIAD
jgi:hypothetical protein